MVWRCCWSFTLLASFASGALALDLDTADRAEIFKLNQIVIVDPWAKSAIGAGHAAKLFFEFRNNGTTADRLVNARSPLANGPTQLYAVTLEDDVRHLLAVDAIDIPVSPEPFELTELGYFIELSDVQVPILMGKRFPVELEFERAGRITVEFVARFHSPKLVRRIRAAAARGDVEALKSLRPTR